jgi:hypothetical protein
VSQGWAPLSQTKSAKLDTTDKAERLLRNLACRLDQEAPSVAASILEGLDEILTITRLKLPTPLRRSLACTDAIENMMGTVRCVCRNVKRWRNAAMALRRTAAGMLEPIKGFHRLKARKHLPVLRAALAAHHANTSSNKLNTTLMPHSITHGDACFAYFNKIRGIPPPGGAVRDSTGNDPHKQRNTEGLSARTFRGCLYALSPARGAPKRHTATMPIAQGLLCNW